MSEHDVPGDPSVIDGRYELGDMIGWGGHGVVYRARDRETGEDVAIKFLHDSVAIDPQYNIRMLREAQVMAALSGTSAIRIRVRQPTRRPNDLARWARRPGAPRRNEVGEFAFRHPFRS